MGRKRGSGHDDDYSGMKWAKGAGIRIERQKGSTNDDWTWLSRVFSTWPSPTSRGDALVLGYGRRLALAFHLRRLQINLKRITPNPHLIVMGQVRLPHHLAVHVQPVQAVQIENLPTAVGEDEPAMPAADVGLL